METHERGLAGSPMVEIKGVHKSFGARPILKDISLKVGVGETVVVIGPSGSGKTTLLRCVNMLEDFQKGDIRVNSQPVGYEIRGGTRTHRSEKQIALARADIGFVFQSFNLFPHMSVMRNVTVAPVRVKGVDRDVAHENALRLLDRVGLREKADAYPANLSGGQQQRVAIARALALEPKLMLFDEVTSALDPELVEEVLAVMTELARDGMTMMVVTHEMQFARQVADRVVFMADGAIVEQGPADAIFGDPRSDRLQSFLRRYASAGSPALTN